MNIREAVESEAELLSALAMRAKAHWGYSDEVLEGWRAELAVSPQGIRARPTFVAMVGIEVAGFYSLSPLGRSWELDHLWVLPRFMHLGVGRALLSHALETAARGGAAEVTVDADPNAEPFYLECGAVRRGAVPAPLPFLFRIRPLHADYRGSRRAAVHLAISGLSRSGLGASAY